MAIKNTTNDVIDLDISVTKKKRFRFDKDDSRLVDINIADMGAISRLSETYPKLLELLDEVKGVSATESADAVSDMEIIGNTLNSVDMKMREALDYIFNAPVSAVAAPDGTMYDIFEGQFRFEYILELLIGYYETNMSEEFKKMQAKVKAHTDKYTKKK